MDHLFVEQRSVEEGEPFPVRFGWPGFMREVVEVLDWWPGNDHSYFKVRGNDGATYILRHGEDLDEWDLVLFETAPAIERLPVRLS